MLRFLLTVVLVGFVAPATAKCLLPSEKPMIEAQLFFGRDIEGRGPVSDDEWSDFAATTIAKDFPDGFTVSNGDGHWLDPVTKSVIHEQSKIVLIAAKPSRTFSGKLMHVIGAYRARFHQQSVGVITREICAAF